jgi:hypothetical protein
MKPGPPIVIACPHCGQYAKKETLLSCNDYGAQLWSDGKKVLPMFPVFPSLVICKKCKQFYWVKDAKEVERVAFGSWLEEKWRKVDFVQFPTFYQYFKALETIPEEKFIRIRIWWIYNDYFRNGKEKRITPEMRRLNSENLVALVKILDETKKNELLMKVDVYRNLGLFDKSRELLNRIVDPDLAKMKEKLLHKINNKNKRVIQLY